MPKGKIVIDPDSEDDRTAALTVPHLPTPNAAIQPSSNPLSSVSILLRSAQSSLAQNFRGKKGIPFAQDIWSIIERDPASFHIPDKAPALSAFYAGKGTTQGYGIKGRATDHFHADTDTDMKVHCLIRENDLDVITLVP
ncbi:uncharacterized protein M437DRAFT_88570 [Aureobasidium melanogenum CBS 110374]|uniref:Uncharacterized protein n=1 Tax=Aureobasidium melanogenum (strain CBS 110374) TaxID=1043003 RepID=A0A074W768_AURM1|nr:uncharacterized protein M437DRAFT_88570 [Aureobasidium melanogenum CBS 110374]KEQ58421.1 hypothetical protein M437DRAFT_88570 [Aureobasidium melanogenum CBS 110374]